MTWLVGASAAIGAACVAASVRRFLWALDPTPLDARLIAAALGASPQANAQKLASLAGAGFEWERAVLEATVEPSKEARDAWLNEELTELDAKVQRWSRVPRVCASVATSAGFLFASIAVLNGLQSPDDAAVAGEVPRVLSSALDALAAGIAAMSCCAAIHLRARKAARDRFDDGVRLVERLQSVSGR